MATDNDHHDDEQEELYGAEESCIFNCPYVEEQVIAEVSIDMLSAAEAAVAAARQQGSQRVVAPLVVGAAQQERNYYHYYSGASEESKDDEDDDRYYYYYEEEEENQEYDEHDPPPKEGELYNQEEQQQEEGEGEQAQEQQQEHGLSAAAAILFHRPPPPRTTPTCSSTSSPGEEPQEEESEAAAVKGRNAAVSTGAAATTGQGQHELADARTFGINSSSCTSTRSSRRNNKHSRLSPEEINFILKWKHLRVKAANEQQHQSPTRNMRGAMTTSLSSVPEKEEVLDADDSAASVVPAVLAAGSSRRRQLHAWGNSGDVLGSFPRNGTPEDTISLLDFDLSTSQDEETNFNYDDTLSSFHEEEQDEED